VGRPEWGDWSGEAGGDHKKRLQQLGKDITYVAPRITITRNPLRLRDPENPKILRILIQTFL
jgi:hypothetical protein